MKATTSDEHPFVIVSIHPFAAARPHASSGLRYQMRDKRAEPTIANGGTLFSFEDLLSPFFFSSLKRRLPPLGLSVPPPYRPSSSLISVPLVTHANTLHHRISGGEPLGYRSSMERISYCPQVLRGGIPVLIEKTMAILLSS